MKIGKLQTEEINDGQTFLQQMKQIKLELKASTC